MTVQKKNAVVFIFITLLIDVIGLGIIIPVVPKLISELTGEPLNMASKYGGWLMFCYAIMQFVFSPVLGNLSDAYGRRRVLLISILGLGLNYIFHALAPTLSLLFIGRLIAGIMGASFTTAAAYMADITPPEKRAQSFGLIGVAFGLGFIIGPLIGGIFSEFGSRVPFYIAACLSLVNFVYGYIVLPESLDPSNRRPFEWKRANPFGAFKHLYKYPIISGMVITLTLLYLAAHAVQSHWSFFTMYRFNWTMKEVGYSLCFVGLLVSIVQGGLIRVVIPKIGKKNSIIFGLLFYAFGLIGFAFVSQAYMMYVLLIPYCLGGLAGPAIQGVMSEQFPPNEQGELQGAMTSLMSATSIIGPLIMNYLFSYFTSESAPFQFPGAAFLAGGLMVVASIFFCIPTLNLIHEQSIVAANKNETESDKEN